MKTIAITQRVEIVPSYGERRDALDQKWAAFMNGLGMRPVLLANNVDYVRHVLAVGDIDGILLTGGNSLVRYGGDAPERDAVERLLLDHAMKKDTPVLGVCRGMQVIQDYFDNDLQEVSGYVGTRHRLNVESSSAFAKQAAEPEDVNAYFQFGARSVTGDLACTAKSEDGVVFAVQHTAKAIYGVMWHVEREDPFRECDMELFRTVYGR